MNFHQPDKHKFEPPIVLRKGPPIKLTPDDFIKIVESIDGIRDKPKQRLTKIVLGVISLLGFLALVAIDSLKLGGFEMTDSLLLGVGGILVSPLLALIGLSRI